MDNYDETLVNIFETAAGKAFTSLMGTHSNELFYYFTLMIDEGLKPYISAWSYEALEKLLAEKDIDDEEEKIYYKWSGVESPYATYGWDEYFEQYRDDLDDREHWDDEDWDIDAEWDLRVNSMEEAMRRLDKKGVFGTGGRRAQIVITAEVIPPEKYNYDSAARLNQMGLISEFLAENEDLLEEEI